MNGRDEQNLKDKDLIFLLEFKIFFFFLFSIWFGTTNDSIVLNVRDIQFYILFLQSETKTYNPVIVVIFTNRF